MNKIYKVIWSKTRNCYVAVAEFVKRNGKGGSVLNRRHIAAALAAVAICAAPAGALANSGGHWDGNEYIGDAPEYNVTINEDVNGIANGRYETGAGGSSGATLSIVTGGKAKAAFGGRAVDGIVTANKVKMTGGEIVKGNSILLGNLDVSGMLLGGFANAGNVEKNTVEISGGTVNSWLIGGNAVKGEAKENSVTVSGGEVKGSVYGGLSANGNAANNTVIISGGTVNGGVYGGQSIFGNTINNTVILSKEVGKAAPDLKGPLYGGIGGLYSSHTNNTLQVEAVGLSAPQIARFDNYKFVLPSDIKAGDTMLTLSAQNEPLTIDGTKVDLAVAKDGGLNIGFGESVTLLHKTGGGGAFSVTNLTGEVQTSKLDGESTGFDVMKYTLDKPDHEDKLNVTVSELFLYGDGGTNTPGQRQTGNTLIINSGKADVAFGGRAASGAVAENNVIMTGGEIVNRNAIWINEKIQVSGGLFGGFAYAGNVEKNTVEISGGTVNAWAVSGFSFKGEAKENSITISGGTAKGLMYGGFSYSGNAANNTVTISGGTVESDVIGGFSFDGDATNNTVTISGGEVKGAVYVGDSRYDATNNTVIISGGTVGSKVYGGWGDRFVTGNTVILSKEKEKPAPVLNGTLFGGNGHGTISNNTLQVEAVSLSAPQIRNFDTYRFVLPSDIKAGDTMLTLTNQNDDDVPIDSSRVSFTTDSGFGLNLGESITLLHKTGGSKTLNLNGNGSSYERLDGEADGLPVKEFKLNVSQENDKVDAKYAARFLYGDGGTNTPGQRETGNTLTITSADRATAAFGGRAATGDVTGNKVEMSGGELVKGSSSDPHAGNLYGGLAEDGNARQNTVTIGGNSSIERNVYGGNGSKGASGNEVTVTGGTVKGTVTGGTGFDGDTADNTVSIHGGSVGGVVHGGVGQGGNVSGNRVLVDGGLFTGYSMEGGSAGQSGNAIGNAVTVAGSATVQSEMIQGGMSNTGTAEKNTVTLKGGLFTNAVDIIGGHGFTGITDNAVNLTDTTKGLDNTKLRGYSDATANHSGNELHIGGAKTYDKNGTATITKGSWQGMDANGNHTNRVDTVSNFDSIALHHVVWGDTPALAAKEIKNIGGLDVTGLEFFTHPDNSMVHEHALKDYMVLVHADTNDLTGLKISYLDEGNVKTETLTNQGIHYRNTVHHSTENGVTVDGKEVKRIFLADHNQSVDFFYHITGDKLTLGEVNFVKNGTARILDGRFDVRNAAIDTEGLTFTAASKLQMAAGDAMTLVDAEDAVANKNGSTLQPFATKQLTDTYSFAPAEGVTVAATLRSTLNATPKNNGLVYKVNSNQADRLTFGSVDWKDSGALFKRPAAVTFAGAAVDTSEIHFKNLKELKGNAQMTLVSDFGGSPGRITGTTYKIGTTLEGEGAASLVNGDLIFTTKAQEKKRVQEQTHNTVMGMMAGLAALSGGTEQLSQGMDSFGGTTGSGSTGSTGNAGDNTTNGSGSSDSRENSGGGGAGQEENEREANGSIIASIGGNKMHQETGSHVTSNTWNGVLGIGGKRVVKNGTWQYAAFAEHGRANFTLHSDAGRGDGTSKYTGGGLLAKWQSRHDVYVEGSLRAGRMHDTASDLLYDAATGQSYGYDVHANYIGGHVGLGKVFRYNNGRSLDVYGKYFHMKRDGVSFEAEGHYDLDSVTSSVLRVGARYGATDKKWNWYGGLAYEYEFDGKATGRADGAEIRAASIKGGSVRGELGIRMEATKTSPWKADIRLTGYAGKRRGIGGNVSVAYTF